MDESVRDENEYQVSLPYPEMKVENKNRQYARLLLRDYAGRISELTCVLQYKYNYLALKEKYPDVAEVMKQIAAVDETHLELLGESIMLLGTKPIYWNTRRYWSSSSVAYDLSIDQILTKCIANETTLIDRYKQQRRQIKDRYIDALLQRILLDDRLHRRTFRRLYRKYVGPLSNTTEDEEE